LQVPALRGSFESQASSNLTSVLPRPSRPLQRTLWLARKVGVVVPYRCSPTVLVVSLLLLSRGPRPIGNLSIACRDRLWLDPQVWPSVRRFGCGSDTSAGAAPTGRSPSVSPTAGGATGARPVLALFLWRRFRCRTAARSPGLRAVSVEVSKRPHGCLRASVVRSSPGDTHAAGPRRCASQSHGHQDRDDEGQVRGSLCHTRSTSMLS